VKFSVLGMHPDANRPGMEISKAIVDCWKSCVIDLAKFPIHQF